MNANNENKDLSVTPGTEILPRGEAGARWDRNLNLSTQGGLNSMLPPPDHSLLPMASETWAREL